MNESLLDSNAVPAIIKEEIREEDEVANPHKNLKWDIFLSYRVNTDQETVKEMYNQMMVLWSRKDGRVLEKPHSKKEVVEDPCAAIYSGHRCLEKIKIFVDYESLQQAEDWAEGFCDGLANSLMFVPFLSWHEREDGSAGGSVGGLSALDPGSGKDWVDNVLLEYEFALAIREQAPLKTMILPVFTGPKDDRGYLPFPFHKVSQLSNERSLKTKQELARRCAKYDITISDRAMKRGIRETVQSILNIQGMKMSDYGLIAVEKMSENVYLASRHLTFKATRVARWEENKSLITSFRRLFWIGFVFMCGIEVLLYYEDKDQFTDFYNWLCVSGYSLLVFAVSLHTLGVDVEMMEIEKERKEDEIKERDILREFKVQDIV